MADIPFSSVSGGGQLPPMIETLVTNLNIKEGDATSRPYTSSNFYTSIANGINQERGFTSNYTTIVADTSEQVIVDVPSGKGVFTNFLSPTLDTNTTIVTLKVVADDKTYTFTSPDASAGAISFTNDVRFAVGGVAPYSAVAVSAGPSGIGSGEDYGYLSSGASNTGLSAMLVTPLQSLQLQEGIPFESSLQITVQFSEPCRTSNFGARAVYGFTNFIRKG